MPTQEKKAGGILTKRWFIAAVVPVVAIVLIVFLMPQRRVQLSDQGYDLTLALYRVCNQQDSVSLAKFEGQLTEAGSSAALSDESRVVITDIIAVAKSGRWMEATVACRAALENQVHRK